MSRFKILVFCSFLTFSLFTYAKDKKDYNCQVSVLGCNKIYIEIITDSFVSITSDSFEFNSDGSHGSETDVITQASGLAVEYGNVNKANFNNLLETFKIAKNKPQWVWGITVKLSAAPTLLRDSVEDDALDSLDKRLKRARQQLSMSIPNQVDAALQANPQSAQLPPIVLDGVREQLIQEANTELDLALANQRSLSADSISDRLDTIELQTSFQQIQIGLGKVLNGGKGMLSLKFGKIHLGSGALRNSEGKTRAEKLSGLNSIAGRAGIAGNTTGFDLGSVFQLDPKTYALLSLAVFHERNPWIEAKDFIANQLVLPQNVFDRQKDFSRLDSWLLRAVLVSEDKKKANKVLAQIIQGYDVYASLGQYDGNFGHSFGADVRLPFDLTLTGDYFEGDRQYAQRAYGLQLTYGDEDFALFGRIEAAEDVLYRGQRFDKLNVGSLGGRLNIFEDCILSGRAFSQLIGKVSVTHRSGRGFKQEPWKAAIGTELKINFLGSNKQKICLM